MPLFGNAALDCSAQAGPVDRVKWDQDFFLAYDNLYRVAERFKSAVIKITPPAGFKYAKEDMQEYRVLLNSLYEKHPE